MEAKNQPIRGTTTLFGIVGNPVSHSLSPLLHNAAFVARKIDAVYVPFPVRKANRSLKKGVIDLGICGLSVTIPHKGWAAEIADRRDELSRISGAANTLRIEKDGTISAWNTDGPGALAALRSAEPILRGRRFLLLGYGGSAVAIAHALLLDESPAILWVSGRNRAKCEALVTALKSAHCNCPVRIEAVELEELRGDEFDIVIQTTPLGMVGQSQELPLPKRLITKHLTLFDIVYNPPRTPFLQQGLEVGAKVVYGWQMLLHQAILQFEIFTGEKAPAHLMEKEILHAIRTLR